MGTKKFQEDVKESAQKIWLAGLGALAAAEEEGGKLFKTLVEKGESFQERQSGAGEKIKEGAGKVKDRAGDILNKVEAGLNDAVATVLNKMGVPTREEINGLTERVDALTDSINQLLEKEKPAAKAAPKADKDDKAKA